MDRRHFATGVTVASAGILALGLVTAPPVLRGADAGVGHVQLAVMAAPSPPALLDALEKFISNRGHTLAPVAGLVSATAEDNTSAFVRMPFAFARAPQPTAFQPRAARETAESALAAAISTPQVVAAAVVENVYKAIVTALLVPFAFAFFGIILVVSAIQNYFYNAENAVAFSALTNEPTFGDAEPVTPEAGGSAEGAPDTEAGEVSRAVIPTEPATGNDQTSTDKVVSIRQVTSIHQVTSTHQMTSTQQVVTSTDQMTETAEAEGPSEGVVAEGAPEPVATDLKSVPVSTTERRTAPGTVVRGSPGVGDSSTSRPRSGNGGDAATETAGDGDGVATAGDSSDSSSSRGDSSGGESGES